MPNIYNKSFLKWAGGKSQLLDKIYDLMPLVNSGRLIEPFVGSGVVSLNVHVKHPDIKEIIIGDTNDGLIGLWSYLKWDKNDVIENLEMNFNPFDNNEKSYYEIRDKFNYYLKHWNERYVSRMFLYLNRHCFNGLCRFNSKGEFNVPYGKYKSVYFPEAELLHAIEVMKKTSVRHCSFDDLFTLVKPGDIVYCDPPYLPENDATANFTAYSKGGFGLKEHKRLVIEAEVARNQGATVIISNNDVPLCKELYKSATEIHYVDVRKSMSCKANGRKKLREVIAVYRP